MNKFFTVFNFLWYKLSLPVTSSTSSSTCIAAIRVGPKVWIWNETWVRIISSLFIKYQSGSQDNDQWNKSTVWAHVISQSFQRVKVQQLFYEASQKALCHTFIVSYFHHFTTSFFCIIPIMHTTENFLNHSMQFLSFPLFFVAFPHLNQL